MSRVSHGVLSVRTRRQVGEEVAASVYRYTRQVQVHHGQTVRTPCQAREEDAASVHSYSVSTQASASLHSCRLSQTHSTYHHSRGVVPAGCPGNHSTYPSAHPSKVIVKLYRGDVCTVRPPACSRRSARFFAPAAMAEGKYPYSFGASKETSNSAVPAVGDGAASGWNVISAPGAALALNVMAPARRALRRAPRAAGRAGRRRHAGDTVKEAMVSGLCGARLLCGTGVHRPVKRLASVSQIPCPRHVSGCPPRIRSVGTARGLFSKSTRHPRPLCSPALLLDLRWPSPWAPHFPAPQVPPRHLRHLNTRSGRPRSVATS
jgi:hypothetical protein